jgi:5S rRNA maturation endonuclease (ribonuclease M5)
MSADDLTDLASLCEPVARIVWGKPSSETVSELRWGTRGARVVHRKKHVWYDHERNLGGGTLELVPGATQEERLEWLRDQGLIGDGSGGSKKKRNGGAAPSTIVATYDYTDESGALLFQVVRFAPKDFRQRRPNGKKGWTWSLGSTRRVLYRLPEVRDAVVNSRLIVIVEGEKDADNLRNLGFTATCNPGGANKWRAEYTRSLRGADVVLVADNDDCGRTHVAHIASSLRGAVHRLRVLDLAKAWSACPAKGDISDWIKVGGTAEEFAALVEMQQGAQSESIELAHLLAQVYEFIGRFIAYPSDAAHVAHVLWIAHAHLMDAWDSTPRLAFLSPEPSSGKTRALEITELLVPNAVEAINVTPAYLFRKVGDEERGRPTILYDEIDTVFGPKAKENEDIRGLLNAGHRRGAVAGRCVVHGKRVETEEIPAYCAVALAGLGWLPDTILTRSIVIRMRRRAPGEVVTPFRRRVHAAEGNKLKERLATWAVGAEDAMMTARPDMPPGVEDRNADVWEALLAIADAAGAEWSKRAREAASVLIDAAKEAEPSLGIRLLADLKTIFDSPFAEAIRSETILSSLIALPESPWGELKGKPLSPRGLASRLRQYGVKSKAIRVGEQTLRGYTRDDLHDAWVRYLPPQCPTEVQHVQHAQQTAHDVGFSQESAAGAAVNECNGPYERNGKGLTKSVSVADVADVAEVQGNRVAAQRCDHCGSLGRPGDPLKPWNWRGRPGGIWLHPQCEAAWFDSEGPVCR